MQDTKGLRPVKRKRSHQRHEKEEDRIKRKKEEKAESPWLEQTKNSS